MIVRTHENTINSKVEEIFNKSKLFEVSGFEGVTIPSGDPREVDFRIHKYDICGEGEWKSSAPTGISQACSYLTIPGVRASFVILYPVSLKAIQDISLDYLEEVQVDFCFYRRNGKYIMKKYKIKDLPNVIKTHINSLYEEVDISIIIDAIQQAVSVLQAKIDIGKITQIFKNVLFAETTELKDDVTLPSTAYFLLNQILFYRILSNSPKYRDKLPDLKPNLEKSQDLDEIYFSVAEIETNNYKAIFDYRLAPLVKEVGTLNQIIEFVNAIRPEKIKGDFLGKVFHQLIPFSLRKQVASFYTLEGASQILAELTITRYDQKVYDPACGSGTLLSAAYSQKKRLSDLIRPFNQSIHDQFIKKDLFGTDIMAFAAHLSVIHLAIKSIENLSDDVQIAVADSTKLHVGFKISSLPDTIQRTLDDFLDVEAIGKTPKKSKITIQKRNKVINLDGVTKRKEIVVVPQDVILMNPPFTKKQLLKIEDPDDDRNYRSELKKSFSSYYQDNILNGSSPFYAYFICLADKLLGNPNKGDKLMGIVLPIIFLRSDNEKYLRDYIHSRYWIKYILIREDSYNFSEDTQLREMLIVLQKKTRLKTIEKRPTSYVFLQKFNPDNMKNVGNNIINIIHQNQISPNQLTSYPDFNLKILQIPQNCLESSNLHLPISLFSFNYVYTESWLKLRESNIFLKVKDIQNLSIETKNNPEPKKSKLKFGITFFSRKENLKSNKEILFVKESGDNFTVKTPYNEVLDIPKKHCLPGVRIISQKDTMDLSELDEYVIVSDPIIIDYPGADWEIWKEYTNMRTSNLVLVDRIDYTTDGYSHLAFFSEVPRIVARSCSAIKGMTIQQAKIVTLWMNSSMGILDWILFQSPQRFGYCQHHKVTLMDLVFLDADILNQNEIEELNQLFDEIGKIKFPSLLNQFVSLLPLNEYKDDLEMIIVHYNLGSLMDDRFVARLKLDILIIKIVINHLNSMELKNFVHNILKESLNEEEIDGLIKPKMKEKLVESIVQNLHTRLAKIILFSKAAMDKNFNPKKFD